MEFQNRRKLKKGVSMSKIINGTNYNIIYLDTNAISEMSKNYKGTMKNLLGRFGFTNSNSRLKYAFATSTYNLKELSNSTKYRQEIIRAFNIIPLLIVEAFPSIIDKIINGEDIFFLGIGIKPLFNTDISDIFRMIESDDFNDANIQFENHIAQEIVSWNEAKKENLTGKDIFNNSYKIYNTYNNNIDVCFDTKCAKIFTFIKTYFLYKKRETILRNSVIDSFNASVAPFVDIYIGERTVTAWLKESKHKYNFMKEVEILKISEFYSKD